MKKNRLSGIFAFVLLIQLMFYYRVALPNELVCGEVPSNVAKVEYLGNDEDDSLYVEITVPKKYESMQFQSATLKYGITGDSYLLKASLSTKEVDSNMITGFEASPKFSPAMLQVIYSNKCVSHLDIAIPIKYDSAD